MKCWRENLESKRPRWGRLCCKDPVRDLLKSGLIRAFTHTNHLWWMSQHESAYTSKDLGIGWTPWIMSSRLNEGGMSQQHPGRSLLDPGDPYLPGNFLPPGIRHWVSWHLPNSLRVSPRVSRQNSSYEVYVVAKQRSVMSNDEVPPSYAQNSFTSSHTFTSGL